MQKYFTLIIAFFFISNALSQERAITGKVTAFRTMPVNNILVLSKSTGNKTVTDKNGYFVIKCSVNDVLTFNSECFGRVKKKMRNEKDTINVNLYFNSTPKNREIAVQNNHLSKDSLDYALANLHNLKEDFGVYPDIYSLLKAKFPYIQIIGNTITIPPPAFGTGAVLMIVDGNQVTDISYVQTTDVVSVQVLKGTETSMYGMKGGNGVIIIKTFGEN